MYITKVHTKVISGKHVHWLSVVHSFLSPEFIGIIIFISTTTEEKIYCFSHQNLSNSFVL